MLLHKPECPNCKASNVYYDRALEKRLSSASSVVPSVRKVTYVPVPETTKEPGVSKRDQKEQTGLVSVEVTEAKTLKDNEWECDSCKRINQYDSNIKTSYKCTCGFSNKVIKDLIGQMNDIDLVNEQKALMQKKDKQRQPRQVQVQSQPVCKECQSTKVKIGNNFCDDCFSKIRMSRPQQSKCTKCGTVLANGGRCPKCRLNY